MKPTWKSRGRWQALQIDGHVIEICRIGSGRPLLLCHGTPGGGDVAPLFFTPLAEMGFEIICPSRPGYLNTPIQLGRSPLEQARFYSQILRALQIDQCPVLAYSGGGPSGIHLAANFTDRVERLILVAAVSQNRNSTMRLYQRLGTTSLGFALAKKGFGWAARLDRKLGQPLKLHDLEPALQSLDPIEERRIGLTNDVRWFKDWNPPAPASIRAPTFLVHGSRDSEVPCWYSEEWHRQAPGSSLKILNNHGHTPMLGPDQSAFWSPIQDFLSS